MKTETEYRQPLRTGLAILAAPVVGVSIGSCLTSLLFAWGEPSGLREMFFLIWAGCLIGYPVALVVGLPVHLFLAYRKVGSLKVYLLLGAVIGLLIVLLVVRVDFLKTSVAVFPLISAIVTAALFWRIAVRPHAGKKSEAASPAA